MDAIVGWFDLHADKDDRRRLIQRMLHVLTADELRTTLNDVSKEKKRRNGRKDEENKVALESGQGVVSAPINGPEHETLADLGWVANYIKEDVLSLDVEKVNTLLLSCVSN